MTNTKDNKLSYDAQGFIVGVKKSGQIGTKIRQDTGTVVSLLRQSAKLQTTPTRLNPVPRLPNLPKDNASSKDAKPKAGHTHKSGTNPSPIAPITASANTPTLSGERSHSQQMADTHRTKERLKAYARTTLPTPTTPAVAPLPNQPPQTNSPKQELANDNKTLRLLDRLINTRQSKQRLGGGLLGALLTALSFLPFGRIFKGLFKGGKWLLKLAKKNPVLSALLGGVGLLANWEILSGAKKSAGVGGFIGSVGGALAGAMIGQAIIPIPIVGALIGGLIGGQIGGFVGKTAGGGLYAIATGAFREWLGSFGAVGKGLLSLWDNGIKPLIVGATDSLAWFKETLSAFVNPITTAYDKAVGATTDLMENGVNGAKALWGKGKALFGASPTDYVPPDVAFRAAEFAYKKARDRLLGQCARFVNNAYRAIGYRAGGHGYEVADNLYKYNKGKFEYVTFDENYVPQVGDVMSFTAGKRVGARQRARYKGKTYGHTQIYTKKGWVSDGKQKSMWAGQDYKADYEDGSGKIIVVRPVGGKSISSAPPTNPNKSADTHKQKPATQQAIRGQDAFLSSALPTQRLGGGQENLQAKQPPISGATLSVPALPMPIAPMPTIAPKQTTQSKTAIVAQTSKPKDRDLLHKVV